jgi:UDP-glucose 4-epimerase
MSDWTGRRVLVTGGAGFIGSNLCHALLALGAKVSAVDSFMEGGGACHKNLEGCGPILFEFGMHYLGDEALSGIDVIFSLAAQTGHMAAQDYPRADLDANVLSHLELIRHARASCPSAVVVHTSTRQIYGRPRYLPVDERHPIQPPDCNAISKFAGEQYWLLEHRLHSRPVRVLRLTNVYGPRMRIRDARQNFFGDWIRRAIRGEPIGVWGGGQCRDMAYVDDVVQALILAADCPALDGRALNLGGAVPVRLATLAEMTATIAGSTAGFAVREMPAERRAIDIGSIALDDAEFRRATGWGPEVCLHDGIKRTIEWFSSRMKDYA